MKNSLLLVLALASSNVAMATCGDGVIEASEACDDANLVSGDGCDDACLVEVGSVCDCASGPDITFPFDRPTGQFGGSSAPFLGVHMCPPGEVLHGITGERVAVTPEAITTMDLICGPAVVDSPGNVVLSPQAAVPGARTSALPSFVPTTSYTLTCPDDHAVVGVVGEAGRLIHPTLNVDGISSLQLICAELRDQAGEVVLANNASVVGPSIGMTPSLAGVSDARCASGSASIGMGAWGSLSMVGLRMGCAVPQTSCEGDVSTCREFEVCGDNVIEGSEICDDGNTLNGDSCNSTCDDSVCGDGIVGPAEDCDDGDDITTNGCTNLCTVPFCGDGIASTDLGEECDDFNGTDTDGCTSSCELPRCGDGFVQISVGEQCEGDDACNEACQNLWDAGGRLWFDVNRDNVLDADEDGFEGVLVSLLDGDGNLLATTTTAADGSYSFEVPDGDYSVVIAPENLAPGGALELTEQPNGTQIPLLVDGAAVDDANLGFTPLPRCGDGIVQPQVGEQCEGGDACNDACQSLWTAGGRLWLDANEDNIIDPAEAGLEGVPVSLVDADGDVIATDVTGPGGGYSFVVPDGDYTVVVAPESFDPGGILDLTERPNGTEISITVDGSAIDDANLGFVELVGSEFEGWAAVTTGTSAFYDPDEQWVFGLMDVRNPAFNGLYEPAQYHHPSWTVEQLGNIFGIAVDHDGVFYVTATSNVANYLGVDVWRYGEVGGGADSLAAAGTVYRIGAEGTPEVFAVLPQQATLLSSGGGNFRTTGPGLGNIVWDSRRNQFFVSNMEDGSIYRLDADGNILDVFDPLNDDDGAPGFADLGERVWGMALHNNRLYYGLNRLGEDHIRSAFIRADGGINAVSDRFEFIASNPVNGMPVSDISITSDGKMAVAHRTMSTDVVVYNHAAAVSVYVQDASGAWAPEHQWNPSAVAVNEHEAYGGVSWASDSRIWASSADILDLIQTHGIIGYQYGDLPGLGFLNGPTATASVVKYDPLNLRDTKGIGGDIEIIPGPRGIPAALPN